MEPSEPSMDIPHSPSSPMCLPPTPPDDEAEEKVEAEIDVTMQAKVIAELGMPVDKLEAGDFYYLLDSKWWSTWSAFVGFDTTPQDENMSKPENIDNSALFEKRDPNGKLRTGISETTAYNADGDYTITTKAAWEKLVTWYGGGVSIPCLAHSNAKKEVSLDIHPHYLKFVRSSDLNTVQTIRFSKFGTIGDLKKYSCEEMGVDPDEVQIWDYFHCKKYALLEDMSKNLAECQIQASNDMLLQEKNADGKFPEWTKKTTSYGAVSNEDRIVREGGTCLGAVGLQNLGNTCFMNSILQSLNQTPPVYQLFKDDSFKSKINKDNVLGSQGKLVEAYGGLVQKMWQQNVSVVSPSNFKFQIGELQPRFSGYAQHDSQELLCFLLDGLHEDLNEIVQKPYYANDVDPTGKTEVEIADETMQRHLSRNKSEIADMFLGQFRSTVTCLECSKVSVTFDPYMSVSVPLQSTSERRTKAFHVLVVSRDEAGRLRKEKLCAKIAKEGSTAQDLVDALCKSVDAANEKMGNGEHGENGGGEHAGGQRLTITSDCCQLVEVFGPRVQKYFAMDDSVDNCHASTKLVLYEVDVVKAFKQKTLPTSTYKSSYYYGTTRNKHKEEDSDEEICDDVGVTLYLCKDSNTAYLYSSKDQKGDPLLLSVPRDISGRDLYEIVQEKLDAVLRGNGEVVGDTNGNGHGEEDEEATGPAFTLIKGSPNAYHLYTSSINVDNIIAPDTEDVPFDVVDDGKRVTDQLLWVDFGDGARMADALAEENTVNCFGAGAGAGGGGSERVTLDRCFGLLSEDNKLTGADMWYCPKCKEHREATQKVELWRLPDVLVVHIKRFSYTRWNRDKLTTQVDFPLDGLDLGPHVKLQAETGEYMYDCYAVSNHFGALGGGHYTAFARSLSSGKWMEFDDSRANNIQSSKVNSTAAYVLFYLRRDKRPESWGPPDEHLDVEVEV